MKSPIKKFYKFLKRTLLRKAEIPPSFFPIKKGDIEDNIIYSIDFKSFYTKYPKTKNGKLDMRYSINRRRVLLGF